MGGSARGGEGRPLRAWAAVALWVAVIFLFSGSDFSADNTQGVFETLLRTLFPHFDPVRLEPLHVWIRKGAHVVEYSVLGALTFRALRQGATSARPSGPRAVALALALVVAVAVADESRQSRLEERTGSPLDVGLDLAGGAAGIAALHVVRRAGGRARARAARGSTAA